MTVRLIIEGGPFAGFSRADLVRRARAMLRALQMEDAELSILLTGDNQIQKLNNTYRAKNRPTDVLAFAQREGLHAAHAGRLLGDVVVSVPTATRQAVAGGVDLTSRLTFLLAHGLLHLLGWDHDTSAKSRRMRLETQRLSDAASAASRRRADERAAIGKATGRRTRSARAARVRTTKG